jgi:hypothetical protein
LEVVDPPLLSEDLEEPIEAVSALSSVVLLGMVVEEAQERTISFPRTVATIASPPVVELGVSFDWVGRVASSVVSSESTESSAGRLCLKVDRGSSNCMELP